MLNGDFSFGGIGLPIYDPTTSRQNAAGTWIRDPFPGNRVPSARFDPVAKNFLAQTPFNAPNQARFTDARGPNDNLAMPTRYRSYRTRFDWKIDHQFNSNHKIFGRYSWNIHRLWSNRTNTHLNWQTLNLEAVPTPTDQGNLGISDTYTFSPTMINEFRVGFNRRAFSQIPDSLDQGWAQKLGIPNVSGATFPSFNNLGFAVNPGGFTRSVGEDITVSENLTKVIGRHTLKGGYELFRSRYALKAMATWLPRWWSHGLYFQDDWKPVKNLTLNLGIRWAYESPYNTKYGQQSQFDPNATDPLTGRKGAIVHGGGPLAKKDLNNFQPRLGMAWTINPKWVIRGNFGLMTQDLLAPSTGILFEEYFATAAVQAPPGDPRIAFNLSQGPGRINYPVGPDGTVPFVESNYGHNSHHGVTARVEKRYSAGVVVNAFYTFSKTIDDVDAEGGAGGITYYNRSLEKGRSGYDVNHRFIGVLQYELPFGTIGASGSPAVTCLDNSGLTSWCPMPNRPRPLTGRSARTGSRPRPRIRT